MAAPDEKLVEAAAAVFGVLVFIAIAVAAGLAYGGRGLSEPGAFLLVGGIAVFIVLMAVVGYWLTSRQSS